MTNYAGVPPLADPTEFSDPINNYQPTDAVDLPADPVPGTWGLYDADNILVLTADTVLAVAFGNDFRISDYPLEDGGFESYNKVATPYTARIRMAFAGKSAGDRAQFLSDLDEALKSLELYSVVTPEAVYGNANIARYDYKRESREGAGMIVADLLITEVRLSSNPQYLTVAGVAPLPAAQVRNPGSADIVSGGQVQAVDPTPDVTAAIGDLNPFVAVNL